MAEDATAVFGVKREAEEIGVRTGELCLKKAAAPLSTDLYHSDN